MAPKKQKIAALQFQDSPDDIDGQQAQQLINEATQAGFALPKKLWLAKALTPPCHGACKTNDKTNPGCFCGWVPALNSYKKKGLWQKEPSVLSSLGPDPNLCRRKDEATPCGLNNLGNTCYVNSALQCLFMIPSFRRSIYEVESPIADQEIVQQLRLLFLGLNFGLRYSVDPTTFAKALNLDHSIQQDGQEFFKLLLTKLESLFKASASEEIAGLVPHLFRGAYSYMTVCKGCNRASDSSSNVTDFYELPLQVQGFSNLRNSLATALEAEVLEGDNQYYCEFCKAKADATRQMVLRKLPPYLCMQLQRFVFDYNTMDKKKASNKLSFPLSLDVPGVVASVAQDNGHGPGVTDVEGKPVGEYELVAVLIHKGISASHGHYVAHIKDTAGTWWRFDDETVAEMGKVPAGFPGDHGTTAAAGAPKDKGKEVKQARGGGRGGGRGRGRQRKTVAVGEEDEEAIVVDSDDEPSEAAPAAEPAAGTGAGGKRKRTPAAGEDAAAVADSTPGAVEDAPAGGPSGRGARKGKGGAAAGAGGEGADAGPMEIASSNAYMLLYRQRGWAEQAAPAQAEDLPEGPRGEVAVLRGAFQTACEGYGKQRADSLSQVEARKQQVREVLDDAARVDVEEPTNHWVASTWLETWATTEGAPPPIDNGPLLCPHAKLDPGKVTAMKRLSAQAFMQLQEDHKGGPAQTSDDFCEQCLVAMLRKKVHAGGADDLRRRIEGLLAAEKEGIWPPPHSDEPLFWVSKTWLTGWMKRKASSFSMDSSPTTAITCKHGSVLPQASKFVLPAESWLMLKDLWEAAYQQHVEHQALRKQQQASGVGGQGVGAGAGQVQVEVEVEVHACASAGAAGKEEEDEKADSDVVMVEDGEEAGRAVPSGSPSSAGHEAAGGTNGGTNGVAGAGCLLGCDDLHAQIHECHACAAELGHARQIHSSIKQGLEEEKQALPNLAENILPNLEYNRKYYLIPRDWLWHWKQYLRARHQRKGLSPGPAVGAKPTAPLLDRPTSIGEALSGFMCPCHPDSPRLRQHPPGVQAKRNKFAQADPEVEELTVISEDEWLALSRYYPAPHDLAATQPAVAAGARGICAVLGTREQLEQQAQQQLEQQAQPAQQQQPMETIDVTSPAKDEGLAQPDSRPEPEANAQGAHAACTLAVNAAAMIAASVAAAAPPPQPEHPMETRRTRGRARLYEMAPALPPLQGPAAEIAAAPQARDVWDAGRKVKGAWWESGAVALAMDGDTGALQAAAERRASHAAAEAAGVPVLITYPPVCQQYLRTKAEEERAESLSYARAEVMVELITESELATAWAAPAGMERRSKRARKGRQPATVSCTTTLRELKFHVMESLGVHPHNAMVYVQGKLAEGDDKTMAELGVRPWEEIRVISTGAHDNNDYASLFGTSTGRGKREVEHGFKNTALLMHREPTDGGAEGAAGGAGGEGTGGGSDGTGGEGAGGSGSRGEDAGHQVDGPEAGPDPVHKHE